MSLGRIASPPPELASNTGEGTHDSFGAQQILGFLSYQGFLSQCRRGWREGTPPHTERLGILQADASGGSLRLARLLRMPSHLSFPITEKGIVAVTLDPPCQVLQDRRCGSFSQGEPGASSPTILQAQVRTDSFRTSVERHSEQQMGAPGSHSLLTPAVPACTEGSVCRRVTPAPSLLHHGYLSRAYRMLGTGLSW